MSGWLRKAIPDAQMMTMGRYRTFTAIPEVWAALEFGHFRPLRDAVGKLASASTVLEIAHGLDPTANPLFESPQSSGLVFQIRTRCDKIFQTRQGFVPNRLSRMKCIKSQEAHMQYSIAAPSRIPGDDELGEQNGLNNSLPFVMKLVRTEEQLLKVCELRSAAYGHHLPHMAENMLIPDSLDKSPGTVIFLAEDKITGEAIGTARLQSNTHQPLLLEGSVDIPPDLKNQALTEITRFSVRPGYNQFTTRQALIKACYLYCCAMQLPTILIGARRPLDRIYESLGYVDIFPDGRKIPLKHAGGIEHRVLKFDVYGAERKWHANQHPLYGFMFQTYHPDIQVFSAVSSGWARPRRADQAAGMKDLDGAASGR